MLYDYISDTYKKLFKKRKLPLALVFRLNNIGARFLSYEDFMKYFDLKSSVEALDFILDDKNMEDILRYALRQLDYELPTYYYNESSLKGYDNDAIKEHNMINKNIIKENKEYRKKK